MNEKFRFVMPTPQRCKEFGVKFEGLQTRTLMWLTGVSCGVSYVAGSVHFAVILNGQNAITVECNNSVVINNVKDRLESYGFTVEENSVVVCENFGFDSSSFPLKIRHRKTPLTPGKLSP